MIVAIDGPAGSGKSSTARALAARLGFLYLDTGAMYRGVGLACSRAGVDPAREPERVEAVLAGLEMHMQPSDDGVRLLLGGEDVSQAIRTPEAGRMASRVSTLPAVRRAMVDQQRAIAAEAQAGGVGVVLEGRDIGTVVFPHAEVKVFMRADPEIRAQRRHEQLRAAGKQVSIDELRAEFAERDARDASRALAPLRAADDAVEIDTTALSFEEQVRQILEIVAERRPSGNV